MPNWRCAKCRVENDPEGNFCISCGQARPGVPAPDTPGLPPEAPGIASHSRSASVLDELRSGDDSPFKQSRATLRQFRAGMPKLADLSLEMPKMDTAFKGKSAFARVTTHELELQAQPLPRLNYALAHCGIPLIPSLTIRNLSGEAANDVLIKAWVATDYGEPWQKTVPAIPPGQSYSQTKIVVPLTKSRLQEVREAEKASLRVDVFTEGNLQISETYPLEVLAYNEWYYHPAAQGITACFVQPNAESVEHIVSLVRDRLQKEYRDTALDGYQSGEPKKIVRMLEALYLTLQKDLQLTYINPPPSFEKPEFLPDGTNTLSQKVFFPEQILKHRRGTCLDLALLCAACVERMGLNPLVFLIAGHAFFGAWLVERNFAAAAVSDPDIVAQLVSAGALFPLNSTTFALAEQKPFRECLEEAQYCLSRPELFMCAVDVLSSRNEGFKPIPPMVTRPNAT